MKHVIILFVFIISVNSLFSQELVDSISEVQPSLTKAQQDSIILNIASNLDRIERQGWAQEPMRGRYKMYSTENIYNFLKLDTATGCIDQVQWSLDYDKEMVVSINSSRLSYDGLIGTFELYATKNMYQFILLDTTDGRTWHVQWGTKSEKRWIHRIY